MCRGQSISPSFICHFIHLTSLLPLARKNIPYMIILLNFVSCLLWLLWRRPTWSSEWLRFASPTATWFFLEVYFLNFLSSMQVDAEVQNSLKDKAKNFFGYYFYFVASAAAWYSSLVNERLSPCFILHCIESSIPLRCDAVLRIFAIRFTSILSIAVPRSAAPPLSSAKS